MNIIFVMLNKTETLIVDTLEHEFLSIGNDPLMSVANLVTCGLIVGTNVPLLRQTSDVFESSPFVKVPVRFWLDQADRNS